MFLKNKSPFYIGKASSLKSRLNSYLKITDLKSKILNEEATNLKITKLTSPIEALIQESQLIKTLKPRYNVLWQDDKNYFYVAFTGEKFPKIFLTHQPSQAKRKTSRVNHDDLPFAISNLPQYIGPFTDGASLKIVLRLLRRYFPYCACQKNHLRECLNAQIGNCPGYCCITTLLRDRALVYKNKKEYQKNIKAIKNILSGRNKKFIKKLRTPSEMLAVENIYSHSDFIQNPKSQILNSKFKIECYDISHFAGKEAVGAMTLFRLDRISERQADLVPETKGWRKFKIKNLETRNDPGNIAEILSRRLNHPEWPYPDIILVDGGVAQFNAAKKAIDGFFRNKTRPELSLLSFAKPEKKIYGPKNLLPKRVLEQAIQQTHRFVIKFHKQTREKKLFIL